MMRLLAAPALIIGLAAPAIAERAVAAQ